MLGKNLIVLGRHSVILRNLWNLKGNRGLINSSKKFKTATFAASVDRQECQKGAEMIGWELRELIEFIIPILQEHKEELQLSANS